MSDQLRDQLRDTTGFLYEIGLLKRYKRTGWSQVGVLLPESIADHSFRVSVIASVVAVMEGADPQRASFLALWHDSQEIRTRALIIGPWFVRESRGHLLLVSRTRPHPSTSPDIWESARGAGVREAGGVGAWGHLTVAYRVPGYTSV